MQVFDVTNYASNPYSFPPVAVATALAFLGLGVLVRERASKASVTFCLLTASGFVWLVSYAGIYSATLEAVALWWGKVENLGVVFIPSLIYFFTLTVTRQIQQFRAAASLCLAASALFACTVFFTDWFVEGVYRYPWGYYVDYGPITIPFLIFFFSLMAINFYLYWLEYRRATLERHKLRIRALLIAFGIAHLGSVDYLAAYGIPVYPFGYLPAFVFILITAYSIWRYRLADITPAFAADHILDHMAEALLVVDSDGVVRVANEQACHLFHKTRAELIGRSIVVESSHFFLPLPFDKMIRSNEGRHYEIEWDAESGQARTLDVTASVIRDKTKEPVAIMYLARDMTERKQAEEALLRKTAELARSNAEREQLELFASIASHDLQEPLQKIMAFGDLLKNLSGPTLGEKGKEYLNRMDQAAARMSQLIRDLLEFSKAASKPQSPESVNLDHLFREVLSDLELHIARSAAKIDLGSLPNIYGDRLQIKELFQNLLSNALKFRKKDQPPHITVRGRYSDDGLAEIRVQDKGIGFDPEYGVRIFNPFERLHRRTEYEGSGLGLAICKKIVDRHLGTIIAKSTPGEGSLFIVTLPSTAPRIKQ